MPYVPVQEGRITHMGVRVVLWRDYICTQGMCLRLWINPGLCHDIDDVETDLLSADSRRNN